MSALTADTVKAQALGLGFDAVGVADATRPWAAGERLTEFLDLGRHGSMDWMALHAERRSHPQALWPEARSAVMVGLNYGPDTDPMVGLVERSKAVVSVYAAGADYHDVLKKKLKRLGRWFADAAGADVKVFVDTAPLMEKPLAQAAGLGWQGKHTNLVSRDYGSWLFLGALLSPAALAPDPAEADHCGTCQACLDVCPTNAFPAPYQLDARRCLAYLSIEHKGPIPRAFRAPMGNRVFGCDDCLAVCPWNKYAQTAREAALAPRPQTRLPDLDALAQLDDAGFRAVFAGSPVKRTGRERILRNVAIAIGNSGDPKLIPTAERLAQDPSALIRGAAVWALAQLLPPEAFAQRAAAQTDPDPDVQAEWRAGVITA